MAASTPTILPADPEVQLAAERFAVSPFEAARRLSKALPGGWTACCTEAGEVYYHQAGKSQWSHPNLVKESYAPLAEDLLGKKHETAEKGAKGPKGPTSHSIYDARSRHVPLDTPRSLFSDATVTREDLTGRAFALHGILSPSEAASYCQSAQGHGFGASDVSKEFPKAMRNNARLVHFSEALASALYRRLLPALCHRDIFLLQPMGFGAEGRWKPSGVNPCFRISRYLPGEHFAEHCDGMYANDDGECSIYSLVLYLNDDYEGGELDFTSTLRFKAPTGTAVLFPHDMRHAALEVQQGIKYVARSELMFRCIDREPPPKEPRIAKDPLFQRMAALYEHIGDLVALGNVDATTKAYQEALGIQIAHQGTEVQEMTYLKHRSLLEDKTWEGIFSFLEPLEVCRSLMPVSRKWHDIARSGTLWQKWFQQRWPSADEILEGAAYGIDAELKDWMGSYRREHLLPSSVSTAVIFPAVCLSADSHEPVPAICRHLDTGLGWDRSLKQRQGWSIGKGTVHGNSYKTWYHNGEVDFKVLPELFAWSFNHFQLRPSEQHLVVPTLPGLMTRSAQERLATILHRRFQVPRLSFASAPLCALAANGLKTGTVIWGCDVGSCSIFCFYEEEMVGQYGKWHFQRATVQDVAQQLATAQMELHATVASCLEHVVISCQPGVKLQKDGNGAYARYAPTRAELDGSLRDWANAEELAEQLKSLGLTGEIHPFESGDVCRGARQLSQRLPLATPASLPASWEWRAFAQGEWHRLPPYISAVFEGALRSDKNLASVQMAGRLGFYLVANLEAFEVSVAEPHNFRGFGIKDIHDMHLIGPWCPLTRFLRGKPSTEPDRRKPEELETHEPQEVTEVQGEAWHVRTLAGKLVFSQPRLSRLHFLDVLSECAKQMQTSQRRLQLLNGTCRIHSDEELQEALAVEEPVLDLLVLVGPEPPKEPSEEQEEIPEDVPGEMASPCKLQRALLTSLQQRRNLVY